MDTCDGCGSSAPLTRTNLMPRPSEPMEWVNTFVTCEPCGIDMGLMTYAEVVAKFQAAVERGEAVFLSIA